MSAWLCAVALGAATGGIDAVRLQIERAAPHPRLLWPAGGDAALRARLGADARLRRSWSAISNAAERMLSEQPVRYQKQGRRLLHRSREALHRVLHLSMCARLTGDDRYARRAMAEMAAAAGMPDWNPSHFLDTAEMTLALAIGYDWLHDHLPASELQSVRAAIERHGLAPYLDAPRAHGWERGRNNWTQVCHAGMVAGALALLEHDRDRAAQVVERALAGLPNAMRVYEPDGNYPEGPGYWIYGTTFNVILIAMLESALGTDFGLSARPGFLNAADYLLHTRAPSGLLYNYADCAERDAGFVPAVLWFAARTQRPELLWWADRDWPAAIEHFARGRPGQDRLFGVALLWADPALRGTVPAARAWYGRGENPLAIYRASWTDPDALYLALKGGTPSASHAHMDIGSFVLEAGGVRWSVDPGAQDYHQLERRGFGLWDSRQGGDRWKLFRYHTRGHSTLVVNGAEQRVESQSPITSYQARPDGITAVVEMSDAYRDHLRAARRRFTVRNNREVEIADELVGGDRPATVRWGLVTRAELEPGGVLMQRGRRLRITVISPERTQLERWPAERPESEYDEPNPGLGVVGFIATVGVGVTSRWSVVLSYEPPPR
ncbi:MAG: heparinase II/III-family protein [Kiritimatiellae bacterium]|nr:heparinase II/III-family protein [Kiritimatiellia bacterium]